MANKSAEKLYKVLDSFEKAGHDKKELDKIRELNNVAAETPKKNKPKKRKKEIIEEEIEEEEEEKETEDYDEDIDNDEYDVIPLQLHSFPSLRLCV